MELPEEMILTIRNAGRIAALTGAGISQESGLRTFRDKADLNLPPEKQPLWMQYRPEELATPEAFERNPELVWDFYAMRRLKAGEVKPNAGHLALAEMAKHTQDFTLITQNVDGLHQRAGSEGVIELHGNITRARCMRTAEVFTDWEEIDGKVPVCPHCGAALRPDVVWFGEMLPANELETAVEASRRCNIFFSIGTSALVQPAASLAMVARRSGATIIEINAQETPLTAYVDHFLEGKAGEILPKLVTETWPQVNRSRLHSTGEGRS